MKETTNVTRRTILGGIAAGVAASTSGCLGVLAGTESLEFESSPVRVREETLSESDYERAERRNPTITREFSAAGQTREVTVTNHVVLYEKAIDLGQLGRQKASMFAVLSTPQIEVADQTLNPVGEMSIRELLEEAETRFEQFTVDEKVDSATVSTLGTEVTVEKFAGTATIQGMEIDVYLHVTRLQHGDDFVVALGAYPQRLSEEEANVLELISNIEH